MQNSSKVVELQSTASTSSMAPLHASSSSRSRSWDTRDTVMAIGIVLALVIAFLALGIAVHVKNESDEDTFREKMILSDSPVAPSGYEFLGSLETGTGEWVVKPSLPVARSDLQAVTVGQNVYVLGGIESSAVSASVLAFNTVFETYNNTKTDMPTPRYRFGAAAVNSNIYCVGGYIVVDGDAVDSMDIYSTDTDSWTTGPAMSNARGDIAMAAADGMVYVFGGYGVGFDMSVTGTLVEAFNPVTSAWSEMAAMPTSRGDIVAVSHGSDIFVAGGWNDASGFLTSLERYSASSNGWTVMADMDQPKGDKAGVMYDNEVMLIGGEITSGDQAPCPWDTSIMCDINEIPVHDVDAFNPSHNVWVKRAPIPEPVFRFAAAVANGAVWVFGGQVQGAQPVDSVVAFFDVEHPAVFVHLAQ